MHEQVHKYTSVNLEGIFHGLLSNRSKSFLIQKARSKKLESMPSHKLPKIWNDNSITLKRIDAKKTFIKTLKSLLIDNY